MSVDITLVIEGIQGETQKRDFSDQGGIDVLAWSWGMTQSGTTHMGSGAGSGKVSVSDITFTKYVDLSTPDLVKTCTTGRHIPKATLYVRKAGGEAPVDYLKLEMNTILVSSYDTGGSGDGLDRVQETIKLNFRSFVLTYTQQSESGARVGENEISFDIARNEVV
ncbi:MAG: Hcp family type VI secretion system effector [Pararhodobacter sp.]